MYNEDKTELAVELGGITYYVECALTDDYITEVMHVSVICDKNNTQEVKMNDKELISFYERYVDDLNDAYQTHITAMLEDE